MLRPWRGDAWCGFGRNWRNPVIITVQSRYLPARETPSLGTRAAFLLLLLLILLLLNYLFSIRME
jgi:hypothetical protein